MKNSSSPDSTDAVVPPSSLFVFLPGDEAPLAEEIRLRLQGYGSVADSAGDAVAEETQWSFWLDLADRPVSYLVWSETVAGPHLHLLDQVAARDPEAARAAARCRYVVGVEGPLSLRHSLVDYQLQLRIAEAVACDCAPLVYDASGFQFRTLSELRLLTSSRTPPRTSCLYTLHRVRTDSPTSEGAEQFWIHTHGMQRAGVPDLELFDVPAHYSAAAQELIETVASLWIQYQTPEPEVPFTVGQGLDVSWRPWHAAAEDLPRHAVGGWDYRGDETAHAGYRAVLVSAHRGDRSIDRVWRPPLDVIEKLTLPETTLFRSAYETRRMTALAKERWSSFGMLFAGKRPADWRFAVKLRFGEEPEPCEHLWFEVSGVRPGKVHGKLISAPAFVPDLRAGDCDWHDIIRVSDWRVFTSFGAYDPETADGLFDREERNAEPTAIL